MLTQGCEGCAEVVAAGFWSVTTMTTRSPASCHLGQQPRLDVVGHLLRGRFGRRRRLRPFSQTLQNERGSRITDRNGPNALELLASGIHQPCAAFGPPSHYRCGLSSWPASTKLSTPESLPRGRHSQSRYGRTERGPKNQFFGICDLKGAPYRIVYTVPPSAACPGSPARLSAAARRHFYNYRITE